MRVQMHCIGLYEEQRQKLELLAGGKRHFSKVVRQLIDEAAQSARFLGEGARPAPMKSTSVRTTNQNAGASN